MSPDLSAMLPGVRPVKTLTMAHGLLFFLQLLQTGDRGDEMLAFVGLNKYWGTLTEGVIRHITARLGFKIVT